MIDKFWTKWEFWPKNVITLITQSLNYFISTLAAARAVLKKHSMMLLTASKAYVRHPELAAAKANRDYVLKQVRCEAKKVSNF